ncbi:hypothetical protein ACE193_06010 [Bernardetia sp. OM2101]|uniref:hypothetical protein n=1 Tax=Bernardetia sp. OM2101 TaxID=3344876 RepID=UPI0035D06349
MKNYLTLLLLLISLTTFGQNLDECGNDDNPEFSQVESEFLNSYFSDQNIDFTGKKVIFVTGSSGKDITTKSDYFNAIKEFDEGEHKIATRVFYLNEQQKIDTGGYDIIITYWVKVVFSDKAKQKIVKRVSRKNKG